MGSHIDGDLFLQPRPPSFRKGEGYVSTFHIHYLVAQLFSVWRQKRNGTNSQTVLTFPRHRHWDTLLVRIWPPPLDDIIVWPPPLSMDDKWFDALARRIDTDTINNL